MPESQDLGVTLITCCEQPADSGQEQATNRNKMGIAGLRRLSSQHFETVENTRRMNIRPFRR